MRSIDLGVDNTVGGVSIEHESMHRRLDLLVFPLGVCLTVTAILPSMYLIHVLSHRFARAVGLCVCVYVCVCAISCSR